MRDRHSAFATLLSAVVTVANDVIAGTSGSRRSGYVPAMDIAAAIVELLRQRAPSASICPSDVARALADDEPAWRALMSPVRDAAAALARAQCIVITQGTDRVDPDDVDRGPIRLRRGPKFPPG